MLAPSVGNQIFNKPCPELSLNLQFVIGYLQCRLKSFQRLDHCALRKGIEGIASAMYMCLQEVVPLPFLSEQILQF